MIDQYQRLTRHGVENNTFSGERPIAVLPFLSTFRTTCDENDIPKGAAGKLMSKYLTLAAKRQFIK